MYRELGTGKGGSTRFPVLLSEAACTVHGFFLYGTVANLALNAAAVRFVREAIPRTHSVIGSIESMDLLRLDRVPDIKTLKECALVASRFREPSQRILLRSVNLGSTHHTYRYVWDIIQRSPHIATYVHTLRLYLSPDDTSSECLPELLGKFTNATQFVLCGATGGSAWDSLEPVVADAIVDLIRQSTLEGFHISSIDRLPIPLVALIFYYVTSASFLSGSVDFQNWTPSNSGVPIPTSMENLLFFDDFEGLGDVLSGADFAIIKSAVQKLEGVFLDCRDMYDVYAPELDPPSFHNFASLRFFSIGLNFDDLDRPGVVSTLCSVLLSRAEEMTIIYRCHSAKIRAMASTTIGSLRVEISTRFRRDFDSDFKSDFVTILRRTSGYMPGMLLQAALQPLFWMGRNEGGRGRMTAGYSARRGTGADKSEIMMVTESHLKSSSKSAANLSRNRLEICTYCPDVAYSPESAGFFTRAIWMMPSRS
ncbi:hypothetical protein B0H11DRAFT_2206180 [Mycena galericulata]|nr:hypothetical protein B0H11DRAFT_2206180 [Mycena galericulata]